MVRASHVKPTIARILLLDDDVGTRELVAYNLQAEGWDVCHTRVGVEALEQLENWRPDAVVLTSTLARSSDFELCRELRQRPQFRNVPIIVLAACSEVGDMAKKLGQATDDLIPVPYSMMDLVSRVRANLRRRRPAILGDVLTFDAITLESETYRVRVDAQPIHLGPTEFRLLATLMERPGRVWSRESLLECVWGNVQNVDPRSVDVVVGRLRKSLGQSGNDYPIRTVRGAGYAIG